MSSIRKVMLLIESSRGSGRALLQGIARYSHDHGPWSFYWEPGGLEKAWPRLKSLDLQGMILRDVGKLEEALEFGIPAVVVGHRKAEVAGLVNVVTDSETIGRLAAEHLLACGFRHFAYCGLKDSPLERATWSRLRGAGFTRRIEEAGYKSCSFTIPAFPKQSMRQERKAIARWLRLLPRPVGVMACNDDCGVQVMEACKLAALAVPDVVGVVGADNDEAVCGLSDPPMSSVAINFERAGYEAAQALDQMMRKVRGVPARITVSPTHIVARRSTDVVAVEDLHLVKALRFIRDHTREPVLVSQVAAAAGLSRRALERRFRQRIGHSILHEIRRLRSELIAHLLIETHLTVGQIADAMGFADVQHFARYFRAAKQMTPLAYRKILGSPANGESLSQIGESFSQSGVVPASSRRVDSSV
jgi:LacI family transcriptional regulator